MPFWRLYYHLVWSTKNREHFISPAVEDRLYAYIVNKAAELDVRVYAINGWFDHVHLVVSVPPKHAIASVVKRLKGASAHNLNHAGELDFHFVWQRGYGALTFGGKQKSIAVGYVESQKEHHRQQTTNGWLERYAEFDEGPNDTGLIADDDVSPVIREDAAAYEVWDDPPL
jgi:REP element-mobilizing transposase RayT